MKQKKKEKEGQENAHTQTKQTWSFICIDE